MEAKPVRTPGGNEEPSQALDGKIPATTIPEFSQQLLFHPIAPLHALVSFVPRDPQQIKGVRLHAEVNRQLLSVNMKFAAEARAFRATIPTPTDTLIYRFQILMKNGASFLSERFSAEGKCSNSRYVPRESDDTQLREALTLQREEKQLEYIANTLRKLPGAAR